MAENTLQDVKNAMRINYFADEELIKAQTEKYKGNKDYMEKYSVRLESFEGPMELLMHLIDKNKIDIYDIPIAELTEQYIDYLDQFREFNLEIASEFLLMAATLLQIKSRMMLPKPPKSKEAEETEDIDPRQELIDRILEYRRYKEVSTVLLDMQDMQEKVFTRAPMELPVHHLPPDNMSMQDLVRAFSNVLGHAQGIEDSRCLGGAGGIYHFR